MTETDFEAYRVIALAGNEEEAKLRFDETITSGLKTIGVHFLTVRDAEQTVGFLVYTSTVRTQKQECFVLDLHVLPAFRRQGHGTMALSLLRELVTPLGFDHIGLSVMPTNDAAHRLYKKCGYLPAFTRYQQPLKAVTAES